MRPLKLTMTAFGPYKYEETIDFSELNGHQLFVISGNTGAGKTTIFDAICFALYGEANGEDRSDTSMLRSDFADENVHTSVDFEFSIRGHHYRIFRQMPHIKSSNKTATGERYELYEIVHGTEIPLVDRPIVSQVNAKIREIVGLTKEQFCQIVMLPQGEFRKLLTSETENKEEILRRIFKTGFYKTVTERLNEKRKTAQHAYEQALHTRDIHMNSLKTALPERKESRLYEVFSQDSFNSYQLMEALIEEIDHYERETASNKKQLAEVTRRVKQMTETYHQAQMINERFHTLEQKQRQYDAMEQKLPEIEAKKHELARAELAGELEEYERSYERLKTEADEQKRAFTRAEQEEEQSLKELQRAEEQFLKQEANNARREALSVQLNALQQLVPIVEQIEQKQSLIRQLAAEEQLLQQTRRTIEQQLQRLIAQKKSMADELKTLEHVVSDYPKKAQRLQEMRFHAKILKDFLDLLEQQTKLEKQLSDERRRYETAAASFQELEKRWLDGQAYLLAQHLHDGQPCPVCGSTNHPAKNTKVDTIPSKEQLEHQRKQLSELERVFRKTEAQLATTSEWLSDKRHEVTEAGYHVERMDDDYTTLVQEGTRLRDEVDSIKEAMQKLETLKRDYAALEEAIERKTAEKVTLDERYQHIYADMQTETALYHQLIEKLPQHIETPEQLHAAIVDTETILHTLEQKWTTAKEQRDAAREQHITAKANRANIEKQLAIIVQQTEDAFQRFQSAITNAGFNDVEAYLSAKRTVDERTQLKHEIDAFTNELTVLRKHIDELTVELSDLERYDLSAMEQQLQQLQHMEEIAREAYHTSETHLNRALEIKAHIEKANEQVKRAETELQIVKDLYDVVRGENEKKLSFERYLQIEFLEQIVQAANERLLRLSNGQFYLVRSERLERRGRQSGLGLDVYDNYTGQKRDVKTLSGGEKFNASLSLALGMADVIQSYQGSISIETMFIDEGFGSLDEESLNKAVDTLIELQQTGRLIGVISHVQELKQAFPAVLDVQKTKEGYSRTTFIVK